MERNEEPKGERGVFVALHGSLNKKRYVYAADRHGDMIDWCEYGPELMRTKEQAIDRCQEYLDLHDPLPVLALVREPRRRLPVYSDVEVRAAALAVLAQELAR